MGISIEQFRSRIGTYDNFLKTKDASLGFKDRYWNIMLMMFYLSVFYLPTLKQVVGQYKIWNEVMFWFTRMICYNVFHSFIVIFLGLFCPRGKGALRLSLCEAPTRQARPDHNTGNYVPCIFHCL